MKRASDHAMLLARRANMERNNARNRDDSDLTEIMQASSVTPKKVDPERKGAPIGNRWS